MISHFLDRRSEMYGTVTGSRSQLRWSAALRRHKSIRAGTTDDLEALMALVPRLVEFGLARHRHALPSMRPHFLLGYLHRRGRHLLAPINVLSLPAVN